MGPKNIVIAADHNGVDLKKHLCEYLKKLNYNPIDLGPYTDEVKVDYVDYARQLGQIIHNGQIQKGILICGTGQGMSIVVNKFQNVRAALIHNIEYAQKSREHNDANILCLGAWYIPPQVAEEILSSWLETSFGEGRHVKRIEKLVYHRPELIVFTNGCFDIIHTGHIQLLNFAKSLGGKLIVGLNSDESISKLKGLDRPINNQYDRKKVLESLVPVDEVIIFDELKATNLIEKLKPNILVKGGEWTAEEVRRRDHIPAKIDIKIFPFVGHYSTTSLIKKIKEK